ncbi:MAG TPA: anti-sigma factor [Fimbriiglobus sp.]|nr:anti-sigma factor [Fimbriiglobus sp.]
MRCQDVLPLLHPYADRELDVVRHVEVETHLRGCAVCAEREGRLRSLRAAVSAPALYHQAPAGLRVRVRSAVLPAARRRRPSRHLVAVAAAVVLLVGASAAVGIILSRAGVSPDDRLAERVVASHVRSLQVDHLTDVASSDRHTVKPWFRGKLDFSPPVPDLAPQGYPLAGGRLDYLTDRPVAALVYHRRLHAINLFTWPADGDGDTPPRALARHGFNVRIWQRAGMTFWAVSDLNDEEFDEFVRLYRERAAVPGP